MSIIVQYNNYKDEFKLKDLSLEAKAIDDEYCLSFAFKGEFKLHLILNGEKAETTNENGKYLFVNLKDK